MMASDKITYLDNNATTAIDPAVLEAMRPYLEKYFANPSSGYRFAAQVRDAIEKAREQVAALLGCEAGEIVFTSCGTESNNTAFHSALETRPECKHIVTTAVEHSAVRKPTQELARHGYRRRSIGPAEFAHAGRCHSPQHGACFGDVGEQRDRRDFSYRRNRGDS